MKSLYSFRSAALLIVLSIPCFACLPVNPTIDVQVSDSSPCAGQTVMFNAEDTVCADSGTLQYTWVFPPQAYNISISGDHGEYAQCKFSPSDSYDVNLKVKNLSTGIEGQWQIVTDRSVTCDDDTIVVSDCVSVWYVSVEGNDDYNGQYAIYQSDDNGPFRTIQAAIDSASSGDEIIVQSGTSGAPAVYYEQLDMKGKSLDIHTDAPDDWEAVENTILDAQKQGTVIVYRGSEGSVSCIEGFTITGGYPAGDGLALHLTLDDGSGLTAADASGKDRDGSLIFAETPVWTSNGHHGGALEFTGYDYIEIQGYCGIVGGGSRTCSAWIKTDSQTNSIICSWGSEKYGHKWMFSINDTGEIGVGVYGGYILGSQTVNDGNWHHVAAVLEDDGSPDLNEVKLYVDGVLDTDTTLGNCNGGRPIETSGSETVLIGTRTDSTLGYAYYYTGTVDDVRIYSRALNDYEIMEMTGSPAPVAYWKMDDISLNGNNYYTSDDSGNGHDGLVMGAALSTNGYLSSVLSFDGTDDYVEISGYPGIAGSSSRTCSAWICSNDFDDFQVIMSWGDSELTEAWIVGLNTEGKLHIALFGGTVTGSTQLTAGRWHHVTVTLGEDLNGDGHIWKEDIQLFVDGVQESVVYGGSLTDSDINTSVGTNVTLGVRNYNGIPAGMNYEYHFGGCLDDVRIYDRVLPLLEIQELANQTKLLAHWKFDDNCVDAMGEHDGAAQSNPVYEDGTAGQAIHLNGTDQYVSVPHHQQLKPDFPFSISTWVRPNTSNQRGWFIQLDYSTSYYAGIALGFYEDYSNKIVARFGDGGGTSTANRHGKISNTSLETGRWYHVVAVMKGYQDISIYINGVDDGGQYSDGTATSVYYPGNNTMIGCSGAQTRHLDGSLDDMRIYNYALTPGEIQTLYQMRFSDGGGIKGHGTLANVAGCIVKENTSDFDGAGVADVDGDISNCFINKNEARNADGGGLADCSGMIINCVIAKNTAENAGAILGGESGSIINCTIAHNSASNSVGGIKDYTGTITNTILWGNTDTDSVTNTQDAQILGGSPAINYCCIQDGSPGDAPFPFTAGTGNIDDDPIFADILDSNYHLQPGSRCIDTGYNNANSLTVDLDGNSRTCGHGDPPQIDMGAYEFQNRIWYVDVNSVSPNPDGKSWTTAVTTIQAGINLSSDGDVVVVADGTYTGAGNRDIDFGGRAITVRSVDGPEHCIIDCDGAFADPHRGFYFHRGEGLDSVVDGFTITGGYANGISDFPVIYQDYQTTRASGGAIGCDRSSPTIQNCIITNNTATQYGGGIIVYYGSNGIDATIVNCVFSNNYAKHNGGGIYPKHRNNNKTKIINCTFVENHTDESGGGLYTNTSYPVVTNCIFWNNTADSGHPQIYPSSASVTYSFVEGGYTGAGNIGDNPMVPGFVDATSNNFRLAEGSDCIDAGTDTGTLPGQDLDGNDRIVDGDSDGTAIVDMGAYEYQPIVNLAPIANDDIVTTIKNTAVDIHVLDNDSDPDVGDSISINSIVQQPAHGTWVIDGDIIRYTPDSGYIGTDEFRYKIIDSGNMVSEQEAIVSITIENLVVTVDAGPNVQTSIPDGSSAIEVSLEGTITVSNPSVTITPLWQCVSQPVGSTVLFVPSGTEMTDDPIIELNMDGMYILKLTAKYGEQIKGFDQVIITVGRENLLPLVDAGLGGNSDLSTPYFLDAEVTDDGRPSGVLSSVWSLFSYEDPSGVLQAQNAMVYFESETSVDTTVTFSQAGTYTLKLVATDGSHIGDELIFVDDRVVIQVTDTGTYMNVRPRVNAGPDKVITPPEDSFVISESTASDDGQPSPLTYQWRHVSGPAAGFVFSDPDQTGRDPMTLLHPEVTFSLTGDYIFELTANDSVLSASDKLHITVNDVLSSGQIEFDVEPKEQWIPLRERAYWMGSISYDGILTGEETLQAQVKWSVVDAPENGTVVFDQDLIPVEFTETQNVVEIRNDAKFSQAGTYQLRAEVWCGVSVPVAVNLTVFVLPGGTVSAASGKALLLAQDSSVYASGRVFSSTNAQAIYLDQYGCTFKPVYDKFFQDDIKGLDAFIQMEGDTLTDGEGLKYLVMDVSGHDHHARLMKFENNTDPIWVTKTDDDARNGNAVQFDGVDDYIDFDFKIKIATNEFVNFLYEGIEGNQERTCMAWIRMESTDPQGRTIMSWGNDSTTGSPGGRWELSVTDNGQLRVDVDNGSNAYVQTTSVTLHDGVYHHVAVTLQDENHDDHIRVEDIRLFVDGVQKTTTFGNDAMDINTNNNACVVIGAPQSSSVSNYFKGTIDEVRIYHKALSENDIFDLKDVLHNDPIGNPGANSYTDAFGTEEVRPDVNYYENPAVYLNDIECIAAGYIHNLAVDYDGKAWAWGGNTHGQLGVGADEQGRYFITPVQISCPDLDGDGDSDSFDENIYGSSHLQDIVKVSASKFGLGSSFALDRNGQVYAWGANESGQLGIGAGSIPNDVYVPRKVAAPDQALYGSSVLKEIIDIDTGSNHSIACDRYGRVWTWGYNYYGQLGNGKYHTDYPQNSERESVPVAVVAPDLNRDGVSDEILYGSPYLKDIVDVTASMNFSFSVFCGGLGGSIQFYYGNSYAVDKHGHLWAWGHNFHGQLGVGETVFSDVVSNDVGYSAVPLRVFSPYAIFCFDNELTTGNNVDDICYQGSSSLDLLGPTPTIIVSDPDNAHGQVLKIPELIPPVVTNFRRVQGNDGFSSSIYRGIAGTQSRTVTARIKTNKKSGDIIWWGNNVGLSDDHNQSLMEAYWKFDQSSGNRIINSIPDEYNGTNAGQANGTLYGASVVASPDPDRFGTGSLYLNGTNQYVEIDADYKGIDGYGDITVTAWIRNEGYLGDYATILSWGIDTIPNDQFGNKWVVSVTPQGQLRLDVDDNYHGYIQADSSSEDFVDLTNGDWHHIAVSFNSQGYNQLKDAKLYIDGELVKDTYIHCDGVFNHRFIEIYTTQLLKIGAEETAEDGVINYFKGYIDDIRIYRASTYGMSPLLSDSDIKSLAAGGQLWRMRIYEYDPDGTGTIGVLRLDVGTGRGYIFDKTTDIADGDWHHVAAVLPEGCTNVQDVELYIDGNCKKYIEEQPEQNVAFCPCEIDTIKKRAVCVGGGNLEWEDYFVGYMDDIQLYECQLDSDEILDLAYVPGSIAPLKDIIAVSAGGAHVLALDSNGSVWAWGSNGINGTGGALGLGKPKPDPRVQIPRQVLAGLGIPLTDIVSIDAGFDISFAVDRNGCYWAWGEACPPDCSSCCNGEMGVGDNETRYYATPIHLKSVLRKRYVDPDVHYTWYQSIQPAVDDAQDGDEIIVYPGRYFENVIIKDKNILLRSSDPMDWDTVRNTIIDGSAGGDISPFVEGGVPLSTENFVVFFDDSNPTDSTIYRSVLAGFTIENALLDNNNSYGVYCWTGTEPVILNNIITNNDRSGIRCWGSGGVIKNNLIVGNIRATDYIWDEVSGSGIAAESSVVTVHNNTIVYNQGYGIYHGTHEPEVKSNILYGNSLGSWDGSLQKESNNHYTGDPKFVDPENGDYHLKPDSSSSCINAGCFEEYTHSVFTQSHLDSLSSDFSFNRDIDNQMRISGGAPDIGADEVQLIFVEAGEDKTVNIGESLFFGDAFVQSDLMDHSSVLTVEWSTISAPDGGMVDWNSDIIINPLANFTKIGTYVLKLQLYQDNVLVTHDIVSVTVQAKVTASLSQSQTLRQGTALPFGVIDVYGTIGDDSESLTEPRWIQVMAAGDVFSDESVIFGDDKELNTTVIFPSVGIYKLTLLAEKNKAIVGSDSVIVIVSPSQVSVNAGPDQTILSGESAYLNITVQGSTATTIMFNVLSAPQGGKAQPNFSSTLDEFTVTFENEQNEYIPGEYILAFSAVDASDNLLGADTVTITVIDSQIKVNAGPDQDIQLPARIVYLNGSIEGVDGMDFATEWVWAGTPELLDFSNPGDLGTSITFNDIGNNHGAGVYHIGLLVKEAGTVVACDYVTITVDPESGDNPGDVLDWINVEAGDYADLLITSDNCGLLIDQASATGAYSVEWSCGLAQGVTFIDPAGTDPNPETLLNPRVEFTSAGTYTLSLLARDAGGNIVGYDTTDIVITKFRPTLTASLLPDTIVREAQINLPANVVCVYGSIQNGWPGVTTEWSDPDGIVEFEDAASLDTKVRFPHAGIYWLQLDAYDGDQFIAGDAVRVQVDYPLVTVEAGGADVEPAWIDGIVEAELVDAWIEPEDTYTPSWTQLSGPGQVTFTYNEDPLHPMVTMMQPGVYTLLLSAMDAADNVVGSDTVTLVASVHDDLLVVYAGSSRKVMLPDGAASVDLELSDACVLGNYSYLEWSDDTGTVTFDWGVDPPGTTTATFYTPGSYVLKLEATNSTTNFSAEDTVSVIVYPQNQSLVVEAGGPYPDVVLPAGLYLDEAWLLGWMPGTLTAQWSMDAGPEGAFVSFSPSDTLEHPVAYFSQPGDYTLKLTAFNDGSEIANDTVDVTVCANPRDIEPPSVVLEIPSDLSGVVTGAIDITVSASDDSGVYMIELILDKDTNDEKTLDVVQASSPYGLILQMVYTLQTETLSNGDHTLSGWAMDTSGNVNSMEIQFITGNPISDFQVTPERATHGAETLNFTATLAQAGWTFIINPLDPIYSTNGSGTSVDTDVHVVNDMDLLRDGTGDGLYTARLTSGGYTADLTFLVMFNEPVAQIDNLTGAMLYDDQWNINTNADRVLIVTEGRFELEGRATHTSITLRDDVYYKLEVFDNAIKYYDLELSEWKNEIDFLLMNVTPVAQGAIENGFCRDYVEDSFGQIDFTSLPNGTYQLLLTVKCHGVESYASAEFILDCPLKLGNVQFSQEDITIPVGGVPLRVIRTYNSLNRHRDSDFGYGWEYSIANLDIKLNEMRQDMGGWTRRVGGDFDRDVTLTLPDGRRVTYTFGLESVDAGTWRAVYYAPEGVKAELSVPSDFPDFPFELKYGGGLGGVDYFWVADDWYKPTAGQVDLSYQDIHAYTLTLEDGAVYNIRRYDYGPRDYEDPWTGFVYPYHSYGKPYVDSIDIPSGERIEFQVIDDNGEKPRIEGVKYYEQDGENFVKSIYIQYSDDDSGHIEAIYPPSELSNGLPGVSAVPYVKYTYDDYGNLSKVQVLEDREAAAANPGDGYIETIYVYKDTQNIATHERNHYIFGIEDERGLSPIRYEYDDSGRLIATIDAKGNRIELDHDSDHPAEFEGTAYQNPEAVTSRSGLTSYYFYDNRGNVTLQQDSLGQMMAYAYEDSTNPDSPTKVSTLVPDPDNPGNTVYARTWTRYDDKGRPVFTCDPVYNATTTVYDDTGNVLSMTQWQPIDPATVTGPVLDDPYFIEDEFIEISTTRNYYTDNNLLYCTGVTTTQPDDTLRWHSISVMKYTSETPKNQILHSIQIDTDLLQFEDLFNGTPTYENLKDFDVNSHPTTSYSYNQSNSGSPDQPYCIMDPSDKEQFFAYDEDNRQIASWHYWDDPETPAQNPDKYILSMTKTDSQGRSIRSLRIVEDVTVHNPATSTDLNEILNSIQTLIDTGDATVISETRYNSIGQVEYSWNYTGRTDETSVYNLNGSVTYYKYNELGNTVETWRGSFDYQYDKSTSQLIDEYVEWLTVSQTLYDKEGRVIVAVGPWDCTDPDAKPVGTETVYDALGRVVETRHWNNVAIFFETYKIDATGEKILEGQLGYDDIQSDPITSVDPDEYLVANAWEGNVDAEMLAWTSENKAPLIAASLDTAKQIGPKSYSRTIYDTAGRVLHSVSLDEDGYEQVTSYTYDIAGRQIQVIDPPGHLLDNPNNDLYDTGIQLANGTVTQTVDFDDFNYSLDPANIYDPDTGMGASSFTGTHITETFYEGNRRSYVTDAVGNTTSFIYDDLGRVVTTVLPPTDFYNDDWDYQGARSTTYIHTAYNGLGRKVWDTTGPSVHEHAMEIDGPDFVPEVEKKYYGYDIAGRLVTVVLPPVDDPDDGSQVLVNPYYDYIYDEYGNQVGIIDPEDRLTVFRYDHLGRQIEQYMPFIISSLRAEMTDAAAVYDELATALQHVDSPAVSVREYSIDGRLYKAADYKDQVVYYSYNTRGQLEYERHYANDAAYDPANPTFNADPEIAYTYDNLGRRETETTTEYDAAGMGTVVYAAQYVYDTEGRLHILKSPQGIIEYLYNPVTGRKSAVKTYEASVPIADIMAGTASVLNCTEYGYDEMDRLEDVTVDIRNSDGNIHENAHYSYTQVGSRQGLTLPNGIHTRYNYDERNHLESLTHFVSEPVQGQPEPGYISKFEQHRKANGMQIRVTEEGINSDIHEIHHNLDNLNRMSIDGNYGYSGYYEASYTYDLVGNRKQRSLIVDGSGFQILTTDYQYYDENPDRLWKETSTGPVASIPYGEDQRIYAYADGSGGFSYQMPDSPKQIGGFLAFVLGLPSIWTHRILITLLILMPVLFLWPAMVTLWCRIRRYGLSASQTPLNSQGISEISKAERLARREIAHLGLWKRGLCVLLAYIFLIGPDCFQTLSHASMEFDQISTLSWGRGSTIIEYGYDANGSMTSKVTTHTDTGHTAENVAYEYDLRNRLEYVITTPYVDNVASDTVSIVRYTYNPQGIRVGKHTWTETSGVSNNDDIYVNYLVDPANPTGYAQVLEEARIDGTSMTKTNYVLGDDVISQSKSDWTWDSGNGQWDLDMAYDPQYLLYDGHGSTRQLVRPDKSIINSYIYDGYGVLLQNNTDVSSNPGYTARQETSLLYTGEQFDSDAQQYYLRARYYNANNGLFNRVDPYSGNTQDPQSLHKYAYVHNNPVNNIDPTGMFAGLSIGGMLQVATISSVLSGVLSVSYGVAKGWSWGKIATFSAINVGLAFFMTLGVFGMAFGFAAGGASAAASITAAGIIVTPTALGMAVGNFVYAMKHGDPVDKVFATIDLALAMYATYSVAASARTLPIREEAFAAAAAERMVAIKQGYKKGAAGAMLLNGDPFPARSVNAGGKNMPIDPKVLQVIEGLRQTCVEPRAGSSIIGAGLDPEGAWSAVVKMSTGERMQACQSCQHLLKTFGINDAAAPDVQPLLFLISSFFPDEDYSDNK